jgi:hypothetical protein
MNSENQPRCMNQKIFQIDLSTESISAYLLCCGLADEGRTVSTKNLMEIWNSSKEALLKSLEDLEGKRIVQKKLTDLEESAVYELTDVHTWAV